MMMPMSSVRMVASLKFEPVQGKYRVLFRRKYLTFVVKDAVWQEVDGKGGTNREDFARQWSAGYRYYLLQLTLQL